MRLSATVLAAAGGAVSIYANRIDVAAIVVLAGFATALGSEVASWVHRPEQAWYNGRALAESSKTLAWRYSVGAEPFPITMSANRARELLRDRLAEVSREGGTQVVVDSTHAITTDAMETFRQQPFIVRRSAYVEGRTLNQQRWYARKARYNRRWSSYWRIALILAELLAVILAALRVFGGWDVDLAGLMGACIAAGAAWVALKQYEPLSSAYSMAARELALQADRLQSATEDTWASAAADAEEAISREHTLWLASRTGKSPIN